MAGDVIIGTFFNEELQMAYVTDDTFFYIRLKKYLKSVHIVVQNKSMLNGYIIPEI